MQMDLHRVVLSFLFVAQWTEWLLYAGYQKKLDQITLNPWASETLTLSEAAESGVLIATMPQETFRLPRLLEVFYKTDNASNLWPMSKNWCGESEWKLWQWRNPNWMDKRERTGCRLPDKGGSLFWKLKWLVAWINFLKILILNRIADFPIRDQQYWTLSHLTC